MSSQIKRTLSVSVRCLQLFFATLYLSQLMGCTVDYPIVGYYDSYNEVFEGRIKHNFWIGEADIEIEGLITGVKGTGYSYVTYIPPTGGARGQRGEAIIELGDMRHIQANWIAESLTSGSGEGVDRQGRRFYFKFGLSEEEAEEFVRKRLRAAGIQPPESSYEPKVEREKRGFSTGTGFFVSNNGHFITNYHVVDDASRVTVKLTDGREMRAKRVYVDKDSDLALLKVEYKSTPLPIGVASDIKKGDSVFTLGFPLIAIQGQASKASFGRVNSLSGIRDDERLFQVDIPIQPGNSGGPLVNDKGEVVGVVTATLDQMTVLASTGGLSQNVNYAFKSAPLLGLCRRARIQPTRAEGGGVRALRDLVTKTEGSVVLVIAE